MDRRRRLASLALVIVLHAGIVAALLALSHQKMGVARGVTGEAIIWFAPPPKKTVPSNPVEPDAAANAAAPRNPLPDYSGITIHDAPAAAPGGLHGALFGCADLDKLAPEERAHCGSALMVPDDSVDFRDGTGRSRQAALWERGRLRKNGPLLLPCMSSQAAGANLLGTAFCLAKGAVEGGFNPDEQPSYIDKPEVTHLPNNGDPPEHATGF